MRLESIVHIAAHTFIVLGHKDRLAPCNVGSHLIMRISDLFRYSGKIDAESAAVTRLTVRRYVPCMLLHDAIHDRQAEPRALAGILCSEKGIKNAVFGGIVKACAGIGDLYDDVPSLLS